MSNISTKTQFYPPIVPSFPDAFLITDFNSNVNFQFNISSYDLEKIQQIKSIQLSIVNQQTNMSALQDKWFQIYTITEPNFILKRSYLPNEFTCSISIPSKDAFKSDIATTLNQFYKVQIRFCSQEPDVMQQSYFQWLNKLTPADCSEWSKVSILRPIAPPHIDFKDLSFSLAKKNIITSELFQLIGHLSFDNTAYEGQLEQETLKEYSITIKQKSFADQPYENAYQSKRIFPDPQHPNEINYLIPLLLRGDLLYRAIITYKTTHNYSQSFIYDFIFAQNNQHKLPVSITADMNSDLGYMSVHINGQQTPLKSHVIIRRADNTTNFSLWTDIYSTTVDTNQFTGFTWNDYSVENGIIYKYCVQPKDKLGHRGIAFLSEPILCTFDDIFLVYQDNAVKIKYLPSISSFKRTISDAKLETIGSKYPIFQRNGLGDYKTFPITGIISVLAEESDYMDVISDSLVRKMPAEINPYDNIEKELRQYDINDSTIYNTYQQYNETHGISKYNDLILESKYRNKISNFLYDSSVKLFKSPTEGNILVRITDVNFTPNQTLGRSIYSFSANATEIDSCSIENYQKYDIQAPGQLQDKLFKAIYKVGQINHIGQKGNSSLNIMNLLKMEYQKLNNDLNLNQVHKITWMRLQFDMSDKSAIDRTIVIGSSQKKDNINTSTITSDLQTIKLNKYGFYEIKNAEVTTLNIPSDLSFVLDYECEIYQMENLSKQIKHSSASIQMGQLWGTINSQEHLMSNLKYKYNLINKRDFRMLTNLNKLEFHLPQNTRIKVIDAEKGPGVERLHIIPATETLKLEATGYGVQDFWIDGINIVIQKVATDLDHNTSSNLHIKTSLSNSYIFKDFGESLPTNGIPQNQHIYTDTINNKQYACYDSNLYEVKTDQQILYISDSKLKILGYINYEYEITEGKYYNIEMG